MNYQSLQADSIHLHKAHRDLLPDRLRVLCHVGLQGGERYLPAYKAVTDGSFSGVPIVQSSAEANKEIDQNQFY